MAEDINPLLMGDQNDTSVAAAPAGGNPLLQESAPPTVETTAGQGKRQPLEWSDIPSKAVENVWPSTKALLSGIVQPIIHPIDTYEAVKDIGAGLGSKVGGALGVKQDPAQKAKTEATVNALGRFYADRYGTMDGFKEALATDPVGFLADASMVLSGGGSLAARAPGMLGKAGEVASTVGRAVNPINLALKPIAPVASLAAKATTYPLALTTGAPIETLLEAVNAGKAASKPFLEQIRGYADPSKIVDAAHDAVSRLSTQRRNDYLNSKAGWSASQKQLDYTPINDAINSAYKDVTHGQNVYKPQAKDMLDKINQEVLNWQTTPNTSTVNYHNVEGFDKLKQLVNDVKTTAPPGSPAEAMGTRIYNAIRDSIAKQDPSYLNAMGQYSDASDMLKQLKTTLSINPRASVDTTLRKLLLGQKQVDGQKGTLLKELTAIDPEISRMIAGHMLHPVMPIGFRGGIGAALTGGAGLLSGTAGLANPVGTIAHAAASSPRVVGESLYQAGKLSAPGAGFSSAFLAPSLIGKKDQEKERPKATAKRPYFPGPDEPRPLTIRPNRASGGKVGHAHLVSRLMKLAEHAKKRSNKATEPLLNASDAHVVKALEVAQRAI